MGCTVGKQLDTQKLFHSTHSLGFYSLKRCRLTGTGIPIIILFGKKMFYMYRNPHYKPEMVWRPSQVYNGNPYTNKRCLLNTLRPRQNGCHFADDISKCIFLNENVWIPVEISLKFIPKGPINNIPALVQIMAWRRPGDKPLSEPMMVSLLTHICVTQPQWVNEERPWSSGSLFNIKM